MQKKAANERLRAYGVRDVFGLLKRFDLFGSSIPAFHIRGSSTITTETGGCISMGVFFLTLLFATLKLQHMLRR